MFSDKAQSVNPVEDLENKLGAHWPAIRKARETTRNKLLELEAAFDGKRTPDTSLVLLGSIARQEMTGGSDPDWILLVDGQALPSHEDQQHAIAKQLAELELLEPGKTGVFGCMVGSHDLVHKIGGEDDSNSNTTRRVLILLESVPIGNGNKEAYDRVVRQILNRYILDDRGLRFGKGPFRVPRFLANDLTRYWRTVTVDFVYKQRSQKGDRWALRNAKLRMSRKLIFATGLLRCFFCHVDEEARAAREALKKNPDRVEGIVTYLEEQRRLTPLDTLARALLLLDVSDKTATDLFNSYDGFLSILDDRFKREQLSGLSFNELESSVIWKEVRLVGRSFHEGLKALFFEENEQLSELTKEYGIF